jgi:hypothetical protein
MTTETRPSKKTQVLTLFVSDQQVVYVGLGHYVLFLDQGLPTMKKNFVLPLACVS